MQLQSYSTMVSSAAAAVQASCSRLLDLSVGSVLRAVLEASAACGLWMQWLILQVLALTRAATCSGAELDTWMADYAFTRLPGVAAAGSVTFARISAGASALIPTGAAVKTADGLLTFNVTTDTGHAMWNAGLGGYQVPGGTTSATVPVVCAVIGTAGNVQVGSITLIATAIPGIDTVTNAASFTNGAEPESDRAFRARFRLYIAALSKSTRAAVASAIAGVQQGLAYTITESHNPDGTARDGYFFVVLDDGSGAPPSPLLAAVSSAIDAVRAYGVAFGVFAPTILPVLVDMTVTAAAGFDAATVRAAVRTAILAYVNGLGIGVALPFYRLGAVAFGVAGVAGVSAVTANSASGIDIPATPMQVIRATSGGVTVH